MMLIENMTILGMKTLLGPIKFTMHVHVYTLYMCMLFANVLYSAYAWK